MVQSVTPGSSAATAGVEPGDVLKSIGDIAVRATGTGHGVSHAVPRQSRPAAHHYRATRGRTITLNTTVHERTNARVTLERAPNPTPKQAKIWQGLASGL